MMELTDNEIIIKCLDGDKECFGELISRYKNLVYSIVLRMITDKEEANDLAQEVFIKAYKSLDKYSSEFKFSTWIIRITTNHVIDYRRKKKQDFVPIDDIGAEMVSPDSPEDLYLRKEQKEDLAFLLNRLPDMYKVPIVLYHQQGLSYQEISDCLGEPLSKVKNRIFRGRRILKEDMFKMKEGGRFELQGSR